MSRWLDLRSGRHRLYAIAIWCLLSPVTADAAGAQQNESRSVSSEELFTFFYKDPRPERLVGYFKDFQSLPVAQKWTAYPPSAGLFAFVFREYPKWIGRLLPAHPNPKTVSTVSAALRLSGHPAKAKAWRSRFKAIGLDPRLTYEFRGLPTRLEDLHITSATHLDILWGAAFASGEGRFVRMIIDFFAHTANRSERVALDVTRTVVAHYGKIKLPPLKQTYGNALAYEIILAADSLWGVESNGRQHAFVARVLTQYAADHPGTWATKALLTLWPKKKRA